MHEHEQRLDGLAPCVRLARDRAVISALAGTHRQGVGGGRDEGPVRAPVWDQQRPRALNLPAPATGCER